MNWTASDSGHIIFVIIGLFFAGQYFGDGLGEVGVTAAKIKGGTWMTLALITALS
jgi:hypothetical protein